MRHRLIRLFVLALSCLGLSAQAAEVAVEGQDYQVLSPAQPTSNPNKIVVTEFFSYYCSHCYAFYPVVTPWAAKLPSDVAFERVPVSLGRSSWQPISQAFYALQAMGKLEQMDRLIFSGIHAQNIKLMDEESITAFVAKQGISAADFTAAYNSFGVKSSTVRAEQLMKNHKVSGTPALVVDGKYIVPSDGVKTLEEWLVRADKAIALARTEKKKK
ncbi:MAG: thiol:disulfide interchange protein DsbA/DsbL [Steroidobacteraceae bacterium]